MRKFLLWMLVPLTVVPLGLFALHCGGDKLECKTMNDCGAFPNYCDFADNKCKCAPQCSGLCCGTDQCGGTCPDQCGTGYSCNQLCQCQAESCTSDADCGSFPNYCDPVSDTCKCNPQCTGKCCGTNGCGGTCQDNCDAYNQTCNATSCLCEGDITCNNPQDCPNGYCCVNQKCELPDCTNRECGPDPVCNLSCGTCPAGETCNNQNGQCVAQQTCNGPGDCQAGYCCVNQKCVAANCTGRVCGPDPVCGASCGTCTAPKTCNTQTGQCVDCVPNCTGKCCGTDGCGGTCPNSCGAGYTCNQTSCACVSAGGLGKPCPNGASDCDATYPTCLDLGNGIFYCTKVCSSHTACEANNCCAGLVAGSCHCLEEQYCSTFCTDPVNQVGCQAGENCVPTSCPTGGDLFCIDSGPVGANQPCGGTLGDCQAGYLCAGATGEQATCMKMCNNSTKVGCVAGDICVGLTGINTWGVCLHFADCDISKGPADCQATENCLPITQECNIFKCIPQGASQLGQTCQYVNECVRGLICLGTCLKLCTQSGTVPCTTGTCTDISGCPAIFGYCM